METLNHPSDLSASPEAAAASPSWVMLQTFVVTDGGGDAKTAAICRTTTGWLIRVSFHIEAPPATSTFHCSWVGEVPRPRSHYTYNEDAQPEHPDIRVLAAHDNAVLFLMRIPEDERGSPRYDDTIFEHFLYDAGGAGGARRAPSLLLLPGCYTTMQFEREEGGARLVPTPSTKARALGLITKDTGVLRRSEDAVVVAQLEVAWDTPRDTAELAMLRVPGGAEWDLKQLPIVAPRHDGAGNIGELMSSWETDATVSVGVRFLCWVDYFAGVLVCDMAADEVNKLLFLPLPREPEPDPESMEMSPQRNHRVEVQQRRTLAGVGAGALRFVSVDPRCCCGGVGRTMCARSRSAFMVTTWTMNLPATAEGDQPMAWVEDAVLDCDELWALPNYYGENLPRVPLQQPTVSADDPDVVCFLLADGRNRDEYRSWTLEVNTRRKALLSVLPDDPSFYTVRSLLPTKLCIRSTSFK